MEAFRAEPAFINASADPAKNAHFCESTCQTQQPGTPSAAQAAVHCACVPLKNRSFAYGLHVFCGTSAPQEMAAAVWEQ